MTALPAQPAAPTPTPPWEEAPAWASSHARARRRGHWSLALGVAGLVLGGAVGVTVTVEAIVHQHAAAQRAAAGSDHTQSQPQDPGSGEGADPHDRTDAHLSPAEQAYVNSVSDVTYLNFTDSDLIAMGHLVCRDLDAGTTPAKDSSKLGDRYGAGLGDAWDVQHAATAAFCPQDAALLTDPTSGTTGT